ncbi:hypothetical protein CERSUDRAFT_101217 [Gelatoporia subvermispora B]|uniref:Uncharacterized protein n=1 Tax=Ceriporiopsis subvermispora (strain B) TaxID=914234 RepID=M2P5Q5_CERS8|nr:hypothetical protein CERSUDRAFT_101217 [Gelatoporia subvermispora B]
MDVIDERSNLKIPMTTTRADLWVLLCSVAGVVNFLVPLRHETRLTFQTVAGQMYLGQDVDLKGYVLRPG